MHKKFVPSAQFSLNVVELLLSGVGDAHSFSVFPSFSLPEFFFSIVLFDLAQIKLILTLMYNYSITGNSPIPEEEIVE